MANLVQVCNAALARLGTHQAISALTDNTQLARTCAMFFDEARRACLASSDWPFAKVFVPLALTGNRPPPRWRLEYARPACIRVRSLDVINECPVSAVMQGTIVTPGPIPSGSASYLDFGGWPNSVGGAQFQGWAQPNLRADRSPTVIPFSEGAVPVPTSQLAITQTVSVETISGSETCTLGPGSDSIPICTTGPSTTVPGPIQTAYTNYTTPGGVLPVIWTNAANVGAWCTMDVLDPNGWEPGVVNTLSWFLAAEIAVNVTGSAQVQEAMMQGASTAAMKAVEQGAKEDTQVASWNADWIDARGGYYDHGGWGYGDGL